MKPFFLIKHMLSILGMLLLFLSPSLNAQINVGGQPYSFSNNIGNSPMIETMPPVNLTQLQREDELEDNNGRPYRFGYSFEVELNLENSGTWTELQNGDRIWRLMIDCPDAKSINLTYDKFWLPIGAIFYLYNPDKSQLLGGFTANNNKGDKIKPRGFATSFIRGSRIVLEYYEPVKAKGEGIISINKVVHGYRTINTSTRDFGDSGNCQVNVNCQEGADWQNEKRAVAILVVDGDRVCSGSLLNNTCGDLEPLFLTADHCFLGSDHDAIDQPNGDDLMFLWDYEAIGCENPTTEPAFLTTTGATMLANDDLGASSDFSLLRLEEDPADLAGFLPYYLGWDRTGNLTAGGVGIHHPRVDIKKISTHNMVPTERCGDVPGVIPRWLEVFWDMTENGHSVTEAGSSGSPLFDLNHRVLGQLFGGNNCSGQPNCTSPEDDEGLYGAISWSWDNAGATDSRRRLRDWLDPCNTGEAMIDGIGICEEGIVMDIIHDGVVASDVYHSLNSITSSGTVTAPENVTYIAGNFISLDPGFSVGQNAEFLAYIEKCVVADFNSPPPVGYQNNSHAIAEPNRLELSGQQISIKNYPNPFSQSTTFEFELLEITEVKLEVFDISGQLIGTLIDNETMDSGIHTLEFNAKRIPEGIYLYRISTEKEIITQRMILSK